MNPNTKRKANGDLYRAILNESQRRLYDPFGMIPAVEPLTDVERDWAASWFYPSVEYSNDNEQISTSRAPRVYLAGPIHEDKDSIYYKADVEWRNEVAKILVSAGIQPLNPISFALRNSPDDTLPEHLRFVREDLLAVADSDFVLAYFPYIPDRQSVGTFCELQRAFERYVPIQLVGPRTVTDHPFLEYLVDHADGVRYPMEVPGILLRRPLPTPLRDAVDSIIWRLKHA